MLKILIEYPLKKINSIKQLQKPDVKLCQSEKDKRISDIIDFFSLTTKISKLCTMLENGFDLNSDDLPIFEYL